MAEFAVPIIHVNHNSWGPTTLPEQYVGLPFNPFGKGDDIGRAADFSYGGGFKGGKQKWNKEAADYSREDDEFKIVEDLSSKPKSRGFRILRARNHYRNRFAARRNDEAQPIVKGKNAKYLAPQVGKRGGGQFSRGGFRNASRGRFQRNIPTLEASVQVEKDWEELDKFDINSLQKLSSATPSVSDLRVCGQVYQYDKSFDSVCGRKPAPLKRNFTVRFDSVSTMDDPVIEELAAEFAQNPNPGRVVFATDEILAHIMNCGRTNLPWDVYFTSAGNGLVFIDKREDSNLHLLSVNESLTKNQNMEEKPAQSNVDKIDEPAQMSIEATAINQNFSQQVIKKVPGPDSKSKSLLRPSKALPNPFFDEEDDPAHEPAPFVYKYRKFKFDDMTIVARTELHAWIKRKDIKESGLCYMTCYALNEANPKVTGNDPWKKVIDTNRGTVFATEMKNNAFKVAKWATQSILSGAELMKIGYVARNKPNVNFEHSILVTQYYRPEEFALQINLREQNMWAILKHILGKLYQMPAGRYVLMKDPAKATLQLLKVPNGTFDREDESGDDEDDEE